MYRFFAAFGKSPFGEIEDGLADFRGAPLKWPLQNFDATGLDLSLSHFKSDQMSGFVIQASRFDNVSFSGTILGDFRDCSFDNARLNLDFIRARLEDCRFAGTKFSKSTFTRKVIFVDCLFDGCDFSKIHFMGTHFHRCTLRACKTTLWTSFAASRFEDCQLSEMEFGEAIMEEVVII